MEKLIAFFVVTLFYKLSPRWRRFLPSFLIGHPLAFHVANDLILFEKEILKKKGMGYLTCSVDGEKSRS